MNSKTGTKSYEGFTLIECCIALFVVSVCCLFLTTIVKTSVKLDASLKKDSQYEWHVFLIQLEESLNKSSLVSLTSERMAIRDDSDKSVYYIEKYNTMIRRKKGGTGHEPLLLDIQRVIFSRFEEGVTIEVEFLQGEKRTANIPIKENSQSLKEESSS